MTPPSIAADLWARKRLRRYRYNVWLIMVAVGFCSGYLCYHNQGMTFLVFLKIGRSCPSNIHNKAISFSTSSVS